MHACKYQPLFFTLDPLPGNINLPLDHLPSRSTNRFPLFNTVLKVKHFHYIICKVLGQFFPLLHA